MNEFLGALIILISFVGFAFMALIGFIFYIVEFIRKFGKKIDMLINQKKSQSKDCEVEEINDN